MQSLVVPVAAEYPGIGTSRGTAVRLAGGRLLSASHILGPEGIAEGLCRARRPGIPTPPRLSVEGGGPAALLRAGEGVLDPRNCELAYRSGADLALLASPAPGPAATPCAEEPPPGAPVLVATRRGTVPGRLADEAREADPAMGTYRRLRAELIPGDSGGGVFEARTLCLAGIVSQRDPEDEGAAWIVRTETLRRFLAAGGPG